MKVSLIYTCLLMVFIGHASAQNKDSSGVASELVLQSEACSLDRLVTVLEWGDGMVSHVCKSGKTASESLVSYFSGSTCPTGYEDFKPMHMFMRDPEKSEKMTDDMLKNIETGAYFEISACGKASNDTIERDRMKPSRVRVHLGDCPTELSEFKLYDDVYFCLNR